MKEYLKKEFEKKRENVAEEYLKLKELKDAVFDCQTKSHILLDGGDISIACHSGRISDDLDLVMKQIELNKVILKGRCMELDDMLEHFQDNKKVKK